MVASTWVASVLVDNGLPDEQEYSIQQALLHGWDTKSLVQPHCAMQTPYPFKLPARLVIATVMHKLASIAIPTVTCLFVIFADVWLVIESYSGSDMLTRT